MIAFDGQGDFGGHCETAAAETSVGVVVGPRQVLAECLGLTVVTEILEQSSAHAWIAYAFHAAKEGDCAVNSTFLVQFSACGRYISTCWSLCNASL